MIVSVKSSRGYDCMATEHLMASKRMFSIEGSITSEMAQDFIMTIAYYQVENSNLPVKVLINSSGGSIDAGMAIYDTIQGAKVPIELYCTEKAYSMGAVIFACGKHGRYILPHSKVMVHEPLVMSNIQGKTSSIRELSDNLNKVKVEMDALIAKHTGKALEEVEKATSKDTYFTAEEAVAFGLADKIVDFSEMIGGISND